MKIFIAIVILVVLVGLGWYFYSSSQQSSSQGNLNTYSSPSPTPSPSPTGSPTPTNVVTSETLIKISDSGFSPTSVKIKVGDTVKFVNEGTTKHWPASGPHPAHTACPGFDSKPGINPGESYSFTFTQKKTCPMHDHLNPSHNGSIIVQ